MANLHRIFLVVALSSGTFPARSPAQTSPVQSFPDDYNALAAHGDWLIVGREDQLSFFHWDAQQQDFQHVGSDFSISPLLVATDGDLVAVLRSLSTVEFYRLAAGPPPSVVPHHVPISNIELVGALAVDGLVVLGHGEIFSGDRTVRIYDEPAGSVQPPELLDTLAPPVANDCPDYFGNALAVQGDIVVVGANCDGATGEVHVYDRIGHDTWSWVQELEATDLELNNRFGQSLAMDGKWLAVGAPGDNVFSQQVVMDLDDAGSVYVFRMSRTGPFVFEDYLTRDGHETGDLFGTSVALRGSALVAGAPLTDQYDLTLMSDLNDVGNVEVHLRAPDGSWPHFVRLRPGSPLFHIGAELGSQVAIGDRGPVAVALQEETTYAFSRSWEIFADGFELGDTGAWSASLP